MSSYIDLKFINEISARLGQFKKKGDYLFNFRCPHCGDSKKSKTKARAYLYQVKNDMFFKCHNCGEGQSLYKGSAPSTPKPKFDFKPTKFEQVDYFSKLKKISELDNEHPAKKVVIKRKIPEEYFSKLYLCDKFMKFVNEVKPNTFPHTKGEHPRLIIPFYGVDGKPFAFQGRAFGNEQPKYLTIKFDDTKQKVFGLDRINLQEHIYIVEGPIDSMFINNCLAAGGADLTLRVPSEQVTYIFDNEPRNKEIIKRMQKVIDDGYNVVIWPNDLQLKDVNDLIISGLTKSEVANIISTNTYSKLSALTQLNNYKKC